MRYSGQQHVVLTKAMIVMDYHWNYTCSVKYIVVVVYCDYFDVMDYHWNYTCSVKYIVIVVYCDYFDSSHSSDFQWHNVYACSLFYTIVSCCMFSVFLLQAPIVLFIRCFNASCAYAFRSFLILYNIYVKSHALYSVIILAKPFELVTHVSHKTTCPPCLFRLPQWEN